MKKIPPRTRWAGGTTGGTTCPTIENNAPALVAQAVPPATCDFFAAPWGRLAPENVTVIPNASA
jgi:hypothetical protein